MRIIVIAGGKGMRMRPLTLETPKPLLRYRGATNLDHLFLHLPAEIGEAILLLHYLPEKIRAHCGERFHGRIMHYALDEGKGTGTALLSVRDRFSSGERFAVAYADEVFVGDELHRAAAPEFSWLCYHARNPTEVGIATVDAEGYIRAVIEKPREPASDLTVDGFMVVNTDIFSCTSERHANGELYLTGLMNQFVKTHPVKAVMASPGHGQLTTPDDIEQFEKVPYA